MSRKEIWIHGTTEEAADNIVKNGEFDLSKVAHGRNRGHGVYLTQSDEIAKKYGDTAVEAEINMDLIWDMSTKEFMELTKQINGTLSKPLTKEQMKEVTLIQKEKLGVMEPAAYPRDKRKKLLIFDQKALKIKGKRKL